MKRAKKHLLIIVLISVIMFALVSVIATETYLRAVYGLGNPPLLAPDEDVGYYNAANQSLKRFGNTIFYNEFHQRSEPLMENPDYRILMIGDSVTNGGVLINQNETISEFLESKLNQNYNMQGEVLSASAPSWGLENELEYIKKFGVFNSDIVILQIGTNDFTQTKSSIDILEGYAVKKPFPAIFEALRYKYRFEKPLILRKIESWYPDIFENDFRIIFVNQEGNQLERNLNAAQKIIDLARMENKKTLILLVPKRSETYQIVEVDNRAKFIDLCESNQIECINLLESGYNLTIDHFRDSSHFTAKGNELVADILFEYINERHLIR
jgi:lysophospholipase L1-like esterase